MKFYSLVLMETINYLKQIIRGRLIEAKNSRLIMADCHASLH